MNSAIADAQQWCQRLRLLPNVRRSWIQDADKRLDDLQQSGDVAAYWRDVAPFEEARDEVFAA